jgi:hypothetical protein
LDTRLRGRFFCQRQLCILLSELLTDVEIDCKFCWIGGPILSTFLYSNHMSWSFCNEFTTTTHFENNIFLSVDEIVNTTELYTHNYEILDCEGVQPNSFNIVTWVISC